MALSPNFNKQSVSNSHNDQQLAPRKKKLPPSQGFTSAHWLEKHEKIKAMVKYGGPGQYTMEQVKQHNKRDDCWIVLNGHIFDITEYIPYHPGGDEILKAKGRDGTVLFYTYHRWVNIDALIKNCWIGRVINYQPPNLDKVRSKTKKQFASSKLVNPNDKNKQEAISRTRQLLEKQQNKKQSEKQDNK